MASRITNLFRSFVGASFLGMIGIYAVIVAICPAPLAIKIGDSLVVPVSLFAAYLYGRVLIGPDHQTGPAPGYASVVTLGISAAWLANAFDRATRLIFRLVYDIPALDSYMIAFYLFLLTWAGCLHLYARSVEETSSGPSFIPVLAKIPAGIRWILCALAWGTMLSAFITLDHYGLINV